MVYEPLYHALQIIYGNCTRLLKIKNKLNWLFLQIESGRILDILRTFFKGKALGTRLQLFHSRLADIR